MLLKADKNKARQKRHLRVRNHIAGTALVRASTYIAASQTSMRRLSMMRRA